MPQLTEEQRDDLTKARDYVQSIATQAVEMQTAIDYALTHPDGPTTPLSTHEVLDWARKADDAMPSIADFEEV